MHTRCHDRLGPIGTIFATYANEGFVMGTRQTVRRAGIPTIAEENLVTALVLDSPVELNSKQVNGLAKALRRPVSTVRTMIEKAQTKFRSKAERYVEVHLEATEAALRRGTDRSLEVATKASQWAIEKMSGEGARIIEPAAVVGPGQLGPRVMIGVKIGGMKHNDAQPTIDVTAEEVPNE